MRVINLVILLILSISQLLQGQSLCSENLRQVFFGPDNVVIAESDPSSFYIFELDFAIDSLRRSIDAEYQTDRAIAKDISALKAIKQEWLRWSSTQNIEMTSKEKIEIKEFFYIDTIENVKAMDLRGGHSQEQNCLRSNPVDCIFYGRLKKWAITIRDDYENTFIPDFHRFANVGMEVQNGKMIFFKTRPIALK